MLDIVKTLWADLAPWVRYLLLVTGFAGGMLCAWIVWGCCGERIKPLKKERAKLKSRIRRLKKEVEHAPAKPCSQPGPAQGETNEHNTSADPSRLEDDDMVTLEVSLENANQPLEARQSSSPRRVGRRARTSTTRRSQRARPQRTAPRTEPIPRPQPKPVQQQDVPDEEGEAFADLRSTVRVQRLRDIESKNIREIDRSS